MTRALLGKLLYGALFALVVPLGLWRWARWAAPAIHLPALRSVPLGGALIGLGLLAIGSGMWALRVHGGGLPMNAFPPPRFVSRGAYALVPHPIYLGFTVAVFGCALLTGSASGAWLVTPLTALGCVALVLGYERPELLRRFGPRPVGALRLPDASAAPATARNRLAVYLLVLGLWLLGYEAFAWIGPSPRAISTAFGFEGRLPVLEWTELLYASTYALVLLAPLFPRTRGELRRFALRGLFASVVGFALFLGLPFLAVPRPFVAHGWLGRLLLEERRLDTAACAFPSFHVAWAILAAEALAARWPKLRVLARGWAAAIALSCLTTGMHTVLDVLAGALLGVGAIRSVALWEALRRGTERIANSWREWRVGRLRLINHGAYAGLGTAVAIAIVLTLSGEGSEKAVAFATLCGLVGAGIWAQLVEGSSQLSRPYGFYGGLLGVVIGTFAAPWLGGSTLRLLAAFAVAGPWVQAIGRLRCLVQGCCHGAPCSPRLGIRYHHPRSRVVRLSELAGTPVHPTQLYSILSNALIALLLARLFFEHASLGLIAGLFLILNGLARFVEEAFRGEPQTPIFWGLRLYQWTALLSVLGGIALSGVAPASVASAAMPGSTPLLLALALGLLVGIAMGVDFPESNRRFSRLA